ncbi:3-phosphoshikimate 1-carboxyvinyltransferase [Desulfosalsimonas propionicica]|uniref:3-phosphoshikimate 1-carboxyvinyltransferase n=1 Tax=Desulfosalsimonas propionicica TaxID=332175 RepID=A0A7W0C7L7_9BACT|nr:3-phosphoshikimate 1-carboxyvinyltransferase [Desulfosalsimonas propionicica]MBA2880628.1 3-phosphoshikimate 1-carboxyvinyltransferase [Desulfosalsimonas propionicica]
MRPVKCADKIDADITVPGSKSYSHRTAIAAALSNGKSFIYNYLNSQDTSYTLTAIAQLGIKIEHQDDYIVIHGQAGRFDPGPKSIYLGNSGTSMRLLTAVAALGQGPYRLSGTERMHERPIGELLAALEKTGASARSVHENNCPPVEIKGGDRILAAGTQIDCSRSSQYLSGLLLMAPCTQNGMDIHVTHGPVSKPYVDMTLDIMARFGIQFERQGFACFHVPGGQTYEAGTYTVEPDCSQAGYFWAAAAITGGRARVLGIDRQTRQGDIRFVDVLEKMGCSVFTDSRGITVTGGELTAVDADMGDMPDMVPTLAVVAAFARGTTTICNAAHLRTKESDRLAAVAAELEKIGVAARATDDGLVITGPPARGAQIATYDDHRIAMSFAVAGLAVPGITIADPDCVKKSFPDFWEVFEGLYL